LLITTTTTIITPLVTGLFFPVILLNQQWSPPLRLQASHCSTFHIMCDVPSTAVFVLNLLNVFLVCLTNFSLNLLLLFRWPYLTVHIPQSLYAYTQILVFIFFSASFWVIFLSAGVVTSISLHPFSLLFLIIISGLFSMTSLSVCTLNSITLSHLDKCWRTGLCVCVCACVCVCVCTICLPFQCRVCYILDKIHVHRLYRVSLITYYSPLCGILRGDGQYFLFVFT